MAKYRPYVSASTQNLNVGVNLFGTEQDRMMLLADRVKYWLNTQNDKFNVFRNHHGMSLTETVRDCNRLHCDMFLDNHTNAGISRAEGTETFYYGQAGKTSNSYRLASLIYNRIAPLSPGKDRGVKADTSLYSNGLYVIQKTDPPAALVEHIFHTNHVEVKHFIDNVDKYALEEAKGICEFYNEKWVETTKPNISVSTLINEMTKDGLITSNEYWTKVLNGKLVADPKYLQILFSRATFKID